MYSDCHPPSASESLAYMTSISVAVEKIDWSNYHLFGLEPYLPWRAFTNIITVPMDFDADVSFVYITFIT